MLYLDKILLFWVLSNPCL